LGERATPAVMSCERLLSFVTSISFSGRRFESPASAALLEEVQRLGKARGR
jgi:hypothetical protein